MARKSLSNERMASKIRKRMKNPIFRIEQMRRIDDRIFMWYNKTKFSNLRWSLFQETLVKDDIWEVNSSSFNFAIKFMCQFWVDSLVKEEKLYVVNVVDGFLAKRSEIAVIFKNVDTLKLKEVLEKLVDIAKYFGFDKSVNEDLGLKFEGSIKESNLVVAFDRFRKVVKWALSRQTAIEYLPRRAKFAEALLCNLLKIYVKCIVDAVRKLFIVRVVEGSIQMWETIVPKEKPQSISESSTAKKIEIKSESLAHQEKQIKTEQPEEFMKPKSLPVKTPGNFTKPCKTAHPERVTSKRALSVDTTEIPIKTSKTEQQEESTNRSASLMAPELSIVATHEISTKSCETNDDKAFHDLCSASDLCNLKYSIYSDDKSTDNIWKENWTRSSFAKRFMGNDWLSSLTEDENNYVMRIIDTFLMVHPNVLPILDHYKTSKTKQVVQFLSEIKVHLAFKVNSIKNLGLITKKRIDPSTQIVSMEKFRGFVESVPSSHFELRSGTRTPIRQLEFFIPFISKLLYIQVRCIIDGIRNLFICRFEKKGIRFERKACNKKQNTNHMKSDTSNIGSVDVGNAEEVVEEEDEEEEEE